MQKWTMLMITKSQKGNYKTRYNSDDNGIIMSDILLLPATWRWPVEVHISPLVSLVPPVWCPAPGGKRKLAPATVHFGKNLFWTKLFFVAFPSDSLGWGELGIVEGCRRAAAELLDSLPFCRLRFGLRCPLLSRGPSPQSELFHSSLSLCSPVYSSVAITLNKCLKETFSLFGIYCIFQSVLQHNTTNKAHITRTHNYQMA